MTIETPSPEPARAHLSRRRLLTGATAGGLAALLPASVARAATEDAAPRPAAAPTPPATPSDAITFFGDPDLNYSALGPLSASAYAAGEVGEVLTTFNAVHAAHNTYGAYSDAFARTGRRVAERGSEARRAGHRVTARDCFLRASTYFAEALFWVLATDRPTRAHEAALYRATEGAFAAAAALAEPAFERVAIPYDGRTLPGWLMTPPGRAMRRPTVIVNNGSDGQNIGMYVAGARAAVDRGYNALIFEGPGQGSNLFLRGIPFRPDWEKVITPVVDFLRGHPGVDRRRIMLTGASFGGYLVPRAAAFEHRLAAVVADPGVTDGFTSWESTLPKQMLTWLAAGDRTRFNAFWAKVLPHLPATVRFQVAKRSEIYGAGTFYDQMRLARQFRLTPGIVGRITAPVAVTDPQEETFFPGMSVKLFGWLHAEPRRLLHFTIAEGAQFHCETMAPTVRNDTVLDWLGDHLRPTG